MYPLTLGCGFLAVLREALCVRQVTTKGPFRRRKHYRHNCSRNHCNKVYRVCFWQTISDELWLTVSKPSRICCSLDFVAAFVPIVPICQRIQHLHRNPTFAGNFVRIFVSIYFGIFGMRHGHNRYLPCKCLLENKMRFLATKIALPKLEMELCD